MMVYCENCDCEIDEVIMEADYAADPFWCMHCKSNLDLEMFPLPEHVKVMLMEWALEYGSFIDLGKEAYSENGREREKAFNEKGLALKKMVDYEIEPGYQIVYKPSEFYKTVEETNDK
ncbi:hypothetical protein LGQ02_04135 [Bacillus shivajii]|uniref:hypothetical protein n=1 Tax=Bacillus shivajii TaxID=1983719 RepID=UPI001CFAB78B|nr:hypothetical protein [Bacillus shivajii]UCZ53981.1 hypothetical protein LGQ02_04135 [Bacillus shivajii]